jgi:hypothetical protein
MQCTHCGASVAATAKFCQNCGKPLMINVETHLKAKPGFYKGKHYTEYVDEVQHLTKENKLDDAEKLLIELVSATESEAHQNNWGVAPWYYERLAVVYRKRKDKESEIQILERFAAQKHAPGAAPPKLLARLEKLRS